MFHCLYYRAKKKTPPPINSDNQEVNTIKSRAVVEDGVMKFRDIDHLHEVLELFKDDFALLEKNYGYVSYNSKINQVMDDFELITSESELKAFMKENQNYITTRTLNGEEHYEPTVRSYVNGYIANQDGLFYIQDSVYRVVGEFMISAEYTKSKNLLKVNYQDITKPNRKANYKIKKYIKIQNKVNQTTLKSTSTYLGGYLNAMEEKNGNRRVYLDATAGIEDIAGGFYYYVNLEIEAKKKAWIGWRKYNTTLYITGTDPVPTPPMAGTDIIVSTPYWGIKMFHIPYSTYSGKSKVIGLYSNIYYTNDPYGLPIYFTRAKVKAMTGGTDPLWAIIDAEE